MNTDVLIDSREKKGLLQHALAESSGLSVQGLQRIEKFGQATADDIVAIAQALGMNPNLLVERPEGEIGVHISEAKHLLNAMRNVHQYGISMPDELSVDRKAYVKGVGEHLTELCDLVQMQDGVFSELTEGLEPINEGSLLAEMQDVLDELPNEGLMLIVSRGIKFAKGDGDLAAINNMPLYTITFRFQPIETADSLAVGL
ncbi:helix-turn-helix domain-containing protein [Pusillimonas sp. TS35]|nr:helix-turn-helix domain-containing protein [Pusillimonas sp. TS35]